LFLIVFGISLTNFAQLGLKLVILLPSPLE
jgi:hypothetical protein